MAISRSLQPRQQYGLGSFVKKIGRGVKKIVKSPIGKAAMLGLGAYYMPGIGAKAAGGWGPWASKGMGWGKNLLLGKARGVGPGAVQGQRAGGLWNWIKGNPGNAGFFQANVEADKYSSLHRFLQFLVTVLADLSGLDGIFPPGFQAVAIDRRRLGSTKTVPQGDAVSF